MKKFFSLVLLPVLLLLASCGGNPPTDPPTGNQPGVTTFEVAAGTDNWANGPAVSFMFVFDLAAAPTQPVTVSVSGPPSWNNGAARTRRFDDVNSAGRQEKYWIVFDNENGDYIKAVSGDYTVTATINGQTFTKTVTVDATQLLAQAQISISSVEASAVTATWPAVPGAKSYRVEVYSSSDESLPRGPQARFTTATSATFSSLGLAPDVEYRFGVQALTADFTAEDPSLPSGAFNTSFTSVPFAVPTATTTTFEVAGGTNNWSKGPTPNFMVVFDLAEQPTEPVQVSVSGPAGWNGGESQNITLNSLDTAGREEYILYFGADNNGDITKVVSGDYTVTAKINGQTYTKTVAIDAGATVSIPNITLSEARQTSVSASWSAVPGAQFYFAYVYTGSGDSYRRLDYVYTTSTSATLSDLELLPGVEYSFFVQARPVDFSVEHPNLPAGPFNTSDDEVAFTLP